MYFNVQSDNGTITNDHALRQWSSRYARSIEDVKDPRVAMNLGNLLTSAGFVNVETKLINIPLAAWSNEFEVLVAQARIEVDNLSLKAYFPLVIQIKLPRRNLFGVASHGNLEAIVCCLDAKGPQAMKPKESSSLLHAANGCDFNFIKKENIREVEGKATVLKCLKLSFQREPY
ncbi:conserved hypothetical protein [Histoplasma mississippiense (nom. inval.)]|uniref:conserved hypothetical protein n=1 Tax=Ajellomyces capsulatus (strain NAm1 / WU24) TaxID=2059318 RepID=UPI000157CE09|nr:conserved hypothetical protein [Histoplasma mississippiense (nom. inval.)]EDN10665.1 conserved hypothetical protein [Histoplasma mississippiense (nom. inval.)]